MALCAFLVDFDHCVSYQWEINCLIEPQSNPSNAALRNTRSAV